jgi:hypothetical protein
MKPALFQRASTAIHAPLRRALLHPVGPVHPHVRGGGRARALVTRVWRRRCFLSSLFKDAVGRAGRAGGARSKSTRPCQRPAAAERAARDHERPATAPAAPLRLCDSCRLRVRDLWVLGLRHQRWRLAVPVAPRAEADHSSSSAEQQCNASATAATLSTGGGQPRQTVVQHAQALLLLPCPWTNCHSSFLHTLLWIENVRTNCHSSFLNTLLWFENVLTNGHPPCAHGCRRRRHGGGSASASASCARDSTPLTKKRQAVSRKHPTPHERTPARHRSVQISIIAWHGAQPVVCCRESRGRPLAVPLRERPPYSLKQEILRDGLPPLLVHMRHEAVQ